MTLLEPGRNMMLGEDNKYYFGPEEGHIATMLAHPDGMTEIVEIHPAWVAIHTELVRSIFATQNKMQRVVNAAKKVISSEDEDGNFDVYVEGLDELTEALDAL